MKIHHGDALAVLKTLRANSFDGCLTDPPYGLAFMNKTWDKGVPGAETWREVLRVLKPGAYMLAFSSPRTQHRLACAIEDAGFEIRDCLMWIFGSGFPKAKSCLKPAYEPIILARKRGPMLALAIDASRIGISKRVPGSISRTDGAIYGKFGTETGREPGHNPNIGRWPANVILDEYAAAALDEQTGSLTSGANPTRRTADKFRNTFQPYFGGECIPARGADAGGASRFFYCAKASPAERKMEGTGALRDGSRQRTGTGAVNSHPTVKPLKLTEYLARLILPQGGGKLIVPFAGSGSEMLGARRAGWKVTGIEREAEYIEIANARLKPTPLKAVA